MGNINETDAGKFEDHELTRNKSSFLLLEVLIVQLSILKFH